MAKVTVVRESTKRDRFGDPVGGTSEHDEVGAKIAWATPTLDADRKWVTTTAPTIYFKDRVPDIVRGDVLRVTGGRRFTAVDVQPWEHVRHSGVIAGVAVICKEVD